jgi:hypothetical protein
VAERFKAHIVFVLSVITSIIAIAAIVYQAGGISERVSSNTARIAKNEICIEAYNKEVSGKLDGISGRMATMEGKLEILVGKKK